MGAELQFGKMNEVLEMSGDGGCITVCIYLMPPNSCTLKNG